MTLFDLLFILVFLGAVVAIVRIAVLAILGRFARAGRSAIVLAVVLAIYGAILAAVSIASPGAVVPVGEEQRFDDWAIAVTGVTRADHVGETPARGEFWIVAVRVASHARRRRQRETDVHPYLLDARGRRYEVSAAGQAALDRAGAAGPPLTSYLDPGTSFESRLVFDLPRDARGVAFVKQQHSWFPGLLIIGDPASFLHRPTRVPLSRP